MGYAGACFAWLNFLDHNFHSGATKQKFLCCFAYTSLLLQYTKVIYGYMAFAGFGIFFVLVGTILLQLLVTAQIPLDAFSFIFMLYNFSVSQCVVSCSQPCPLSATQRRSASDVTVDWQVVGVIALFFGPAPTMMKQGYLIVTGVVTAHMFTFIPEWSTWVLLLAMALYDLCAVLTPHGPLKVRCIHQPGQQL